MQLTKLLFPHYNHGVFHYAVCTSLGISKLDTLIVSFPVISFGGFEEGDDTVQTNADLQRIKVQLQLRYWFLVGQAT